MEWLVRMRSFFWWEVDDQNKWVYAGAEMLYRVTGSLIGPEVRTSEGNTQKHTTSTTFFLVTLRLPPAYPPHAFLFLHIGFPGLDGDTSEGTTEKQLPTKQKHFFRGNLRLPCFQAAAFSLTPKK